MTRLDVLLGLQWGDEGKGKIVDVLTPHYDVVARFQGGPNAGHTLEFEGEKYILRSVPSGIFQQGKVNLIGNGVVLDPILFEEETKALAASGYDVQQQLYISKKAHLILPTHRLLDAAYELAKGSGKIGTTGKGIGPAYTDKVGRNGVRVGDLLHDFMNVYADVRERHESILHSLGFSYDLNSMEKQWFQSIEYLKGFRLVDSEHFINGLMRQDKRVLAEGAQGTMLDVDFGSYPFVTSSSTTCAGCCIGLGVSPRSVGEVYGIIKAYCTRVGSGPFPTEQSNDIGNVLCDRGSEFGSVTGRRRRCGWIDLVALRYAVMLNGVTKLILTKSDVLDTFETIRVGIAYKIDGQEVRNFPYALPGNIEPVYTDFPGWQVDMSAITSEAQFPPAFSNYIAFIEKELDVPISIVSVGPDREQTVIR